MKTYKINVQEPYCEFILSGLKTVEGRLNKGKFKDIKTGDILNINKMFDFLVTERSIYKTFKEMINKEGVENVVPYKKTTAEAVHVYYKFYSKEDESKFGVVALKLKNIKTK